MQWQRDAFLIDNDKTKLQTQRIHRFLSTKAYWAMNISIEKVEKAILNSLCFGVYDETKNLQIGYARVVSDFSNFAWLCDVYIEDEYRGKGLSKYLLESIKSHPDLQNLRRFCLATKDAHGLYRQFGFEVTQTPQNWMEIKRELPK